ncbi:MAG: hypothetical protein JWO27_2926 [Frankiales bacterium]|nr:hypothetical protein [Frankiales bacterium]
MTTQEPDRRQKRTLEANPEFADIEPRVVAALLSTGQIVDLRDRETESANLGFALLGLRRFRREIALEDYAAPADEESSMWVRRPRPAPPGFAEYDRWPYDIAERCG